MIQFTQKLGALFIFIFLLLSCNNTPSSEQAVNPEFGLLPEELIESLEEISSNSTSVEIDPSQDNTIVGKKGTVLLISANSLVDEKGAVINDKVTINLKECYSLLDMVSNNLQTVSDGKPLETRGMIYLTAESEDGKEIKISDASPIRIEMPIAKSSDGAKFFTGQRDADGSMNWKVASEPSKMLVPFPIKTLAPRNDFECPANFGFTQDPEIWKDPNSEYYFTNDDLSKYENTLLATREFRARYYSYCMPELTRLYTSNLDKNLWEIDELLVDYFIKDSTERVDYYLNNKPPGINGGKRTKDQEEAHEWLLNEAKKSGHAEIMIAKWFAAQKLTKIDPSKHVDTTNLEDLNKTLLAFDAFSFGWINCDIFYDDPKAKPVNFVVKTSETPSVVNLIFNDRSIILDGLEAEKNHFKFTPDKEGYNKLPVGDSAIILSMGYREGKVTFAAKRIIIGQKESETLKLKAVTMKELKAKLEELSN